MPIWKNCHQCHHSKSCYGSCVSQKGASKCNLKYCGGCIQNRYQQNANEIDLETNWTCFKCRGICNCGACLRSRGVDPTKKSEDAVEAKLPEEDVVEAKLPEGSGSITFCGINLPSENVGVVFQFLEFALAFEKVLNLRKGQSDCIIQEIFSERNSGGRFQYSALIQLITQLLTVILEDKHEPLVSLTATNDSWLTVLGECLEQSDVKFDCFPPGMFKKGIAEFENLDSSKKLMLLNFLCDESLCTSLLKNFIDGQTIERIKQAEENVRAAKDKDEKMSQKILDEIVQAELNKGLALSWGERREIVERMESESEKTHLELLDAINMLKKQKIDDGFGNNLIGIDGNGRVFWKLKSYNEKQNILIQDLERMNDVCSDEKWLSFTSEQKSEIEMYLSSIRMKRLSTSKKETTNHESP